MSKDLSSILDGWDYEPEELQVRIVKGRDGRDKLQMRLELGVLQMELEGRPDGQQPHGCESLLEYHEERASGSDEEYRLGPEDCAELMREGLQYYHRYLSLFQLQRYDLVSRDTARNLRLFAFVVGHAERDRDRHEFDQYRPYVTMMNTRAEGLAAIDRGDPRTALDWIDQGIEKIRDFLKEYDQEDEEDGCQELTFLKQWRKHVQGEWKRTPEERLREQLEQAVAAEDYEAAARLRDQLRRFQKPRARRPGAGPTNPEPRP